MEEIKKYEYVLYDGQSAAHSCSIVDRIEGIEQREYMYSKCCVLVEHSPSSIFSSGAHFYQHHYHRVIDQAENEDSSLPPSQPFVNAKKSCCVKEVIGFVRYAKFVFLRNSP